MESAIIARLRGHRLGSAKNATRKPPLVGLCAAAAMLALSATIAHAQSQAATVGTAGNGMSSSAWTSAQGSFATAARGKDVAMLLGAAAKMNQFYIQNPQSVGVSEARADEILLLIRAAELGDTSQRSRLTTLADGLHKDTSVPGHLRFVVASRLNELGIRRTSGLGRAGILAAYEQSAREMIAQFPKEPGPYRALVAIAESQPNSHGIGLAEEVLHSPAPPAERQLAEYYLQRVGMLGRALPLGFAGSPASFKGKAVILYAWTSANSGPLAKLLKQAPAGTTLVGVNLDSDSVAARTVAANAKLPGILVYDPAGLQGAIARELWLSHVPAIYLIDSSGILRDVHGLRDFKAKVANLVPKSAS